MAWERLIHIHPERADELHLLWAEIRDAAAFILRDPECYGELMRRVRQRNVELEKEIQMVGEHT
jgi:hypothetical protein